MPTRPRPLSNNVLAGVEDIIAATLEAWPALNCASERAREHYMDPVLLADLNRIAMCLSAIEAHARNARHNRYEPRRRA